MALDTIRGPAKLSFRDVIVSILESRPPEESDFDHELPIADVQTAIRELQEAVIAIAEELDTRE